MRFFEFDVNGSGIDKFIMILNHEIGNYARKGVPAKLNWANIAHLSKRSGFEMLGDPARGYQTFKAIYDANPAIHDLIKNFNSNGIELNVPGAPDADEPDQGDDQQSSQDSIEQKAAAAAPKQLKQSRKTPNI